MLDPYLALVLDAFREHCLVLFHWAHREAEPASREATKSLEKIPIQIQEPSGFLSLYLETKFN